MMHIMEFLLQFFTIFIFVFILNLIGEKLIVNNIITKKVVIKNLIICLIVSLAITSFFYIQSKI